MAQQIHTPGPWQITRSFNGYVITRKWSSGFYQRMRTDDHLRTEEDARAALVKGTGSAS